MVKRVFTTGGHAVKRTILLLLFLISSPLFLRNVSHAIDEEDFINALTAGTSAYGSHLNKSPGGAEALATKEAELTKKIGINMGINDNKLTVSRTIDSYYGYAWNTLKSTEASKMFEALVFFEGKNQNKVKPAAKKAAEEAKKKVKSAGSAPCWIILVLHGTKGIVTETAEWLNGEISYDEVNSNKSLSKALDFTSLHETIYKLKDEEPYAKAWVEGREHSTSTKRSTTTTKVLYVIVRVSHKDPEYYYKSIEGKVHKDFYKHHIAMDSAQAQQISNDRIQKGHTAPNSVIIIDSATSFKKLSECADTQPQNKICEYDFKVEHFKKGDLGGSAQKLIQSGIKYSHHFEFDVTGPPSKKINHFQENCGLVADGDGNRNTYCKSIHKVTRDKYKCQADGRCGDDP